MKKKTINPKLKSKSTSSSKNKSSITATANAPMSAVVLALLALFLLTGVGAVVYYNARSASESYSASVISSVDANKAEGVATDESATEQDLVNPVDSNDSSRAGASSQQAQDSKLNSYTVPIGSDPKTIDSSNLPAMTLTTDPSAVVFNGTVGNSSLDSPIVMDINSNYAITNVSFSGFDASKIRPEVTAGSAGFRMISVYYIGAKDAPTQGTTQLTITVTKGDGAAKSVTLPVTWDIQIVSPA